MHILYILQGILSTLNLNKDSVYLSLMNKFKYILMPEGNYLVTFDDYDGNPFTVEIKGQDIVDQLRRSYALDKFIDDLDNRLEG